VTLSPGALVIGATLGLIAGALKNLGGVLLVIGVRLRDVLPF
jgi:hypothetical protein